MSSFLIDVHRLILKAPRVRGERAQKLAIADDLLKNLDIDSTVMVFYKSIEIELVKIRQNKRVILPMKSPLASGSLSLSLAPRNLKLLCKLLLILVNI
jgi:hypothetical protein